MADKEEDLNNIPGLVVEPVDINIPSPQGWTEENDQASLRAFSDLLHYDRKEKELKRVGSSFGLALDEALKTGVQPIIPINELDNPEQAGISTAQFARDNAAIPEDQKQKFLLEQYLGPSFQRGLGVDLQLFGKGLKYYNVPGAETIEKLGDEYQKNAAAPEQPSFFGLFKEGKSVEQIVKDTGTYVKEKTAEGLGSSASSLATAQSLALLLGKKALTPALLAANLPRGVGQAVDALEEERDSWFSKADEAEQNGQALQAQAYRQIADQLDPKKNENIVRNAGVAITLLESASDYVTFFKGVPTHQLDEVKKILSKRFVTTIAKKSLIGAGTEGFTEAFQDFVAQIGVIKAKGIDAWLATHNEVKQNWSNYLESFVAGALPGGAIKGATTTYEQTKNILANKIEGIGSNQPAPEPTAENVLPPIEVPQQTYAGEQQTVELTPEIRTALKEYLANPENTLRKKDYKKIAEVTGLSEDAVPEHLEAAAQEGLIRKDNNGIYRRPATQQAEQIIPETNEAMGKAPIYPEPVQQASVEEVSQPQIAVPEDLDQQYDTLNSSLAADKQKVKELRTILKNADNKNRRGMKAERVELDALNKKIIKDKKKFEELDDIRKAEIQKYAYRLPAGLEQNQVVQTLASALRGEAPTAVSNIDEQYAEIESAITADKKRRDELSAALKNASAKRRQSMTEERKERDSLTARLAENKKRLEQLDEIKSASAKVEKEKQRKQRLTPETGKTFLNYLIDAGGITVPASYVGDTRSIYQKAKSLFGKDIPRRLIMPKGRSIESSGLWDDLVAEGYIPPYLDPNGGPNLYDPTQYITDLIFDEIGGKKVYSTKYAGPQPDRAEEETQVVKAAQDTLESEGLPYNLTDIEEARLIELVLDQGLTPDAAIERLSIEASEDGINRSTETTEQFAVSQDTQGKGQGSGNQGLYQGEGGQASSTGEESTKERGQEGPDDDVIPFSIFRQQKGNEAAKTAAQVQKKFKEAIELFKKTAPESTNLKIYDETFNNLSKRLQDYLLRAQEVGAQPEALYDPVQDIVALSQYGSNPTALVSHEVVHALVKNKLVTRQQISKLAELSRKSGAFTRQDEMEYRQLYRGMSSKITKQRLNEIIEEEAAARLIQNYTEQKASAGVYKKVLDKIVEFLRLIRRAFGGDLTANDIVDMILNGDAAKGKLGKYATNADLARVADVVQASLEDQAKGRQIKRQLDNLGYYSALEEKVQSLKQEKGTGQQFLKMLEVGTKQAERDATGLTDFLKSKESFTKKEIVEFVKSNLIKVTAQGGLTNTLLKERYINEVEKLVGTPFNDPSKFDAETKRKVNEYTDKFGKLNNKKFVENTIFSLFKEEAKKKFEADKNFKDYKYTRDFYPLYDFTLLQLKNEIPRSYKDPHFWGNNNTIAFLLHTIVNVSGKRALLLDEIQSDWGQAIRDEDVLVPEAREKKIAELEAEKGAIEREIKRASLEALDYLKKVSETRPGLFDAKYLPNRNELTKELDNRKPNDEPEYKSSVFALSEFLRRLYTPDKGDRLSENDPIVLESKRLYDNINLEYPDFIRINSEIYNLQNGISSKIPFHPMVGTTGQWVTTILNRALHMAAEANLDYIVIPSGKTVLSYNPGQEEGMAEFYESIVPLNLGKRLKDLGAKVEKQKIEKVQSAFGDGVEAGKGFTVFTLTPETRAKILEDGLPLFSLRKAQDRVSEKPNPLTAPVRGSIPLIGNTVKPISASNARMMRLSEGVNDKGVFAPRAELADWMGLPMVRLQADVAHLGKKLGLSAKQAKSFISEVLDNAQFAYKYKAGENWNIVYVAERADHIVSIAPKLTGRPSEASNLSIVKAFKVKPASKDAAFIASIQDNGIEGIRWKKDADGVDRLLNIVRQASGLNEHPSVQEAIKELNKDQALLRGVRPEILAALGRTTGGQDVKGINNIIRELADGLGVTLKQGGGPSWGYQRQSGVIRNKAYYNFSQFVQNLAPLFESKYTWLTPLEMQHSTELGPLDPQNMDPIEGFKVWMELYITDRTAARQRAPNFYDDFENNLETANPTYLAKLQEAQIAYEQYSLADPIAAVESAITLSERTTSFAKAKKEIRESGLYSSIKQGLLYVYANAIGKDAPMVEAVRRLLLIDLEKTGQKRWLPAALNPAKLIRFIPQAQQKATMDIKNGIQLLNGRIMGPGLPEVLRTALGQNRTEAIDLTPGSRYSHFLSYIVSLRAKQLWERHLNGQLERPPLAVSYQVVQRAIADLEARYPDFVNAQSQLNQFTRALLRLKYEAGLIDTATYNELKRDRFYIPFERSFDEEVSLAFKGGKGVNVTSLLKKIRGSQRDIIDPISILCKDVYATHNLIAVNDVVKNLTKLAEEVGPEAGSIIERINSKEIVSDVVHVEQVIRDAAKTAGLSKVETRNLTQQVMASVGTDAVATAFKQVTIRPGTKPIILFMENGKIQAVRLNDPQLARLIFDSMNYAGGEVITLITRALAVPSTFIRSTVTTNPAFILANLMRDAMHAPAYERKMLPFVSQLRGIKKILFNDPLLEEYIRAGGIMGGRGAAGLDQRKLDDGIKKLISLGYGVNRWSNLSDFFRDIQTRLEASETATRIELYRIAKKRALAQGLSEVEAQREAAFHANDYCDYSRHGIRSQQFRKVIAFYNASLQGMDRFIRTLKASGDYESAFTAYMKYKTGRGPAMSQGERNQLAQSFYAYAYPVMVVGSISAMLWAMYHDDERLRDVPDYIRNTHWVFPLNGVLHFVAKALPIPEKWMNDDILMRLPKPFETAWYANLVERFLWDKLQDDPTWAAKWLDGIMETTLPPLKPAIVDWIAVLLKKDPFTWKDLETKSMKDLAPEDRYTPYTSELAKTLGKSTGSSPVVIDAGIKALGTSWARDLLGLNIPGTPWYNPNKPEVTMDEFFTARRFLWRVGKGSEAGRIVREMMGEEDAQAGVFKRLAMPYSRLRQAAGSYSNRLKQLSPDSANKWLAQLSPQERGYAILMEGLKGKDAKMEKLHPINRASTIGQVTFQLQKELASGVLVLEKGKKKENRTAINTQSQVQARDILMQIQAQEAHNALVLTEEPGYAKRIMFETSGLYDELKAADPAVYKELTRRMKSEHVMPWDGTRTTWPKLKEILESDKLYDATQRGRPEDVENMIAASGLYIKAKYPRINLEEQMGAQ